MRAASGVLALLLPAACSAFVYQPAVGQIWDPSVLRWNGSFYAVSMYSPKGDKQYPSGFLSRSSDGVHWQDVGPIAPSHPNTSWWKGFPLQRPDGTFVLNHGVYDTHGADNTTRDGNDALRILTSANLQDWTEVATSKPDARWYKPTMQFKKWCWGRSQDVSIRPRRTRVYCSRGRVGAPCTFTMLHA